jgi:hypothetical protein
MPEPAARMCASRSILAPTVFTTPNKRAFQGNRIPARAYREMVWFGTLTISPDVYSSISCALSYTYP